MLHTRSLSFYRSRANISQSGKGGRGFHWCLSAVSLELVTSSCLIGLLFVRRYPDMPCAADVINALDQQALASVLAAYGEERHTRKIAAAIAQARNVYYIGRTLQLASIVAGTPPINSLCSREARRYKNLMQTLPMGPICPGKGEGEKRWRFLIRNLCCPPSPHLFLTV